MTTAPTETFATGLPVEIGSVERELKNLWAQGGERMCRASLINLAVYSEATGSLPANTQLIAEITRDHACRAIVVSADPSSSQDRLEAWISAHCHVSRAGNKQICSEQLSFSLAGGSAQLLPSIILSHLDSDLPLHLWWQGEFHDPMDAQLWSWVDRLIYDSRDWRDFDAQFQLVEDAQEDAKQRVVLCDLNWTRLIQIRRALAQFFDAPPLLYQLAEMERVAVSHAQGSRSTAILLVGWLAAQLGWQLCSPREESSARFCDACGRSIAVELTEAAGEAISACSLFAGENEFHVKHEPGADLLEAITRVRTQDQMHQLLPALVDQPAQLVTEELMRGGPHRVYLRALNTVRALL